MADKKKDPVGTLLVLAGLFIGIGVGAIVNNYAAGTLVGLGVGFAAAVVYELKKKK